MNAELLLQHFDRISEAPDAIPRLRRFILDLAVRGKLVEQDPGDEPAAELLKRIEAEKALLTPRRQDAKKGKKDSDSLGALAPWREAGFDVPDGWEWVRIRQVTSDRGQTVPNKDFTYIDVTAINKEVGCIDNAQVVSPDDAPSRARKLVCTGDVLFSCVRPYLLNIAIVEKDIEPPPIASTAFAVLNGFGLVLPRYQWIVLRSPFMVENVESKMRGQAYPAINDSDFAVLPFPLPPLAEQHRIVAKVDELMALCDQLEAARNEREAQRDKLVASSLHQLQNENHLTPRRQDAKKVEKDSDSLCISASPREAVFLQQFPRLTTRLEHIKQLRQTILNLAVRGRLVPQDPNDEPAVELLKRIQAEKAGLTPRRQDAKKGKKDFDSLGALAPWREMGFDLPVGWEWVRLGEICSKTGSGSTPRGGKEAYLAEGIPFLRSQNVYDDGLRLNDVAYISAATHQQMKGTAIQPDDLLLNITGGSIGRCAQVPADFSQGNINQHVAIIRLVFAELNDFTHKTILSPYFQNEIFSSLTGAGREGLPKNRMDEIPIPLPPLAEQHRIVTKVDQLMALCDQLENELTSTEADSRRLLEAVLRDALDTTNNNHIQRGET